MVAGVLHCPESNAIMAAGVPHVSRRCSVPPSIQDALFRDLGMEGVLSLGLWQSPRWGHVTEKDVNTS